MRFLLIEAIKDIPKEYYDEWPTATSERQELITREVLQKLGNNSTERQTLTMLVNAFRSSCTKYGIEPSKNPFMEYFQALLKTGIKLEAKHDAYIAQLVNMSESDHALRRRVQAAAKGDKNASYLLNASLFYRNASEFTYTVRIFETVLEPSKLKKFFKDTSYIKVEQLYEDGKIGGRIKAAGDPNTADDETTLFGQVEVWSGLGGENDAKGNAVGDEKDTGNKKNDASPKSNPQNLSKAQLDKIKTNRETHFTSLEAAEKAGIKDGQVVYIDFNKDMTVGGMGSDNWFDTWMVKKNGKWQKYDV